MKANATGHQTFGQFHGKEPVDWKREIRLAKKRKAKSPLNKRLTDLSAEWQTCAVGQQDNRIMDSWYTGPLFEPGVQFCSHIDAEKWDDALNTLKEIEGIAQGMLKDKNLI